jgi:hypothetical protein
MQCRYAAVLYAEKNGERGRERRVGKDANLHVGGSFAMTSSPLRDGPERCLLTFSRRRRRRRRRLHSFANAEEKLGRKFS